MPSTADYLTLAKEIRSDLNTKGLAFKSYSRRDFTERLRRISNEPNTRIKQAKVAVDIENVFRDQGLRFFPKLSDTTTDDTVRVWRAGTIAAEVLDLVLNPGQSSDVELGNMTKKMKGQWDWAGDVTA